MKRTIIFIAFCFCITLLLLITAIMNTIETTSSAEKKYAQVHKNIVLSEREEMIRPSGIFLLTREYKGKNELDDFYREIRQLAENNKERIKISKVDPETVGARIDTDSLISSGANTRFDMDLYNKETGECIKYKVTLSNFYTEKFVKFEEKTE